MRRILLLILLALGVELTTSASTGIRVLNFQGDNGYQHASKSAALQMVEDLGRNRNWRVETSSDSAVLTSTNLNRFDVVIFNNNCGNKGRILDDDQQAAFQTFVREGGGFVGIHCAGAIWHEGDPFQAWYEGLIGTRLVDHPKVQEARLVVEDHDHPATGHLPREWIVTDEWHRFGSNPRDKVRVLISVDEDSYEGEQKMKGDHPFVWCQDYDGGRSFFTSLGHTKEIYANADFRKLVMGAVEWTAGRPEGSPTITEGLVLDLNADQGITLSDKDRVSVWKNQADVPEVSDFVQQDKGRKIPGSGRPRLVMSLPELNGHNAVVFKRQELVNDNEDYFDGLIKGSGYTWVTVLAAHEQVTDLKDVNSFFGNLRNSNRDKLGKYEGIWAGFTDDNRLWAGSRNAITFGRWDENNPYVLAGEPLETGRFHVLAGRMGAGTETVPLQIFINGTTPVAELPYPVSQEVNPSVMTIGQERDAINHPGKESFDGAISRFLLYDRPLSNEELDMLFEFLKEEYTIR